MISKPQFEFHIFKITFSVSLAYFCPFLSHYCVEEDATKSKLWRSLPRYVSDPESTALASGLIALLMSLCFLHHFQTITDTIAFCRGLQTRASKYAEEPEEDSCFGCWGKDSRETEKLLKK